MPCHYARINLSVGQRGFQMFVEIASRMDGRGVEYETRHDVNRGRKSVICEPLCAEYRFVCVYPRARCVDGNTGEMIGLAKFALPGFIPHPASEPITHIVLANRHEYLTRMQPLRECIVLA